MATYTTEELFGADAAKVPAKKTYTTEDLFPAAKPAPAPKRSLGRDVTGATTAFQGKVPFLNEAFSAAYAPIRAISDAVTGDAPAPKVALKPSANPMFSAVTGALKSAYDRNQADQLGETAAYKQAHPIGGALAEGFGNTATTAATMLAPEVFVPLKGAQTAAAAQAAARAAAPAAETAASGLLARLPAPVAAMAPRLAAAGRGAVEAAGGAAVQAGGTRHGTLGEDLTSAYEAASDPTNAAIGATFGQIGQGRMSKAPPRPKAKDFDELADQMLVGAKAKYKAVDDLGIGYTPQAVRDLGQGIHDVTVGIPGNVIKGTEGSDAARAVLRKFIFPTLKTGVKEGGMTMSEIEGMRRAVGQKLLRHKDPDARRLGAAITQQIDDFFHSATPAQVRQPVSLSPHMPTMPAPNPSEANAAIIAARGAFKQHAKAKRIADAYHDATLNAATAHSGANVTNAMRQAIKVMGKRRGGKPLPGATPVEQKQIQRIARGTVGQNLTRLVGSASPEKGGLGALAHVAFNVANPHLLPVTGLTVGARHLATHQTKAEIEKLMGMIANGDPKTGALARQQLEAMTRSNPQVAAELARMQEIAASGAGTVTEAFRDRNQRN